MLDNNLIQSTSSWPFVEIRKLLKDRKDIIKSKKIIFQLDIPERITTYRNVLRGGKNFYDD